MTDTKPKQHQVTPAEVKAHRDQEAVVNTRIAQQTRGSGEYVTSVEEADKKGYFGEKVDPLPDSAYTHPAHKG